MKFLATCFFFLTVLLFGVLFGIYQANQLTMSESEQTIVKEEKHKIDKEKPQQVKQKPMVETVQLSLLERQERAKEVQAINIYSELGESLGNGVETMFKQLLRAITTGMNNLLNQQS